MQWLEARDVVKHPVMHRTVPPNPRHIHTTKNYLVSNVSSA